MIRKLEINILKEYWNNTVSFHSRYVETYFNEVKESYQKTKVISQNTYISILLGIINIGF